MHSYKLIGWNTEGEADREMEMEGSKNILVH